MQESARHFLRCSGNKGLKIHWTWCLYLGKISTENLSARWEEFYKPQANELWARYDLLKSFSQAGSSGDDWYNQVQKQLAL